MSTNCTPILDRVYGTVDAPVTLCPTCGAVVDATCPVTGRKPLPGSVAPVRRHDDRVPVIPTGEFFLPSEEIDWDEFLAEIRGAS